MIGDLSIHYAAKETAKASPHRGRYSNRSELDYKKIVEQPGSEGAGIPIVVYSRGAGVHP